MEILKEPTIGKHMQKIERACKDKHDPHGPIKDKEQIKKIYLEMLKMEADIFKT